MKPQKSCPLCQEVMELEDESITEAGEETGYKVWTCECCGNSVYVFPQED